MRSFKIESIEYGWFEFRIGKDHVVASDYLGYDISKELLVKLLKVLKGSSKEWVYIMNEPGASIMGLSMVHNQIAINIYSMNKPSYDLGNEIEEELRNMKECEYSAEIDKNELVDAVVTDYSLYENGNGRCYYETNWGEFPQCEYDELKKIAFEINKTLREIDSLQCATFMKL